MSRMIEGLTFDDVLLVPGYSDTHPNDVDTSTYLTKDIKLSIPILSAAMDTVTEARMGIAIAQMGGIGVIHKNMSIEHQSLEVDKVKRSESGMIVDPNTITPEMTLAQAEEQMAKYKISGLPVVDNDQNLIGILTNRDLRFETNMRQKVSQVMTRENLITCPEGTNLTEAKAILHQHRIEKILVVDKETGKKLKGLITVKDIQKQLDYPFATKDQLGRLRVAAALGVGDDMIDRATALKERNVDVLCVDSSHAHSIMVLKGIEKLRSTFPDMPIIAGNVVTPEGAEALIKSGANVVKLGIGPGSICTTRVVTGAGMPQITAIMNTIEIVEKLGATMIADGGIKFSGDIVKALAAGAHAVMLGSMLAGTDQSPGENVFYQGRTYKAYRGMGSLGAMKEGSSDRYFQDSNTPTKLVPEGVEAHVPYKGSLVDVVNQILGGLRAGMGLTGSANLEQLSRAQFIKVSAAGLKESHVHDVSVVKEAPNYRVG